MEASSESFARIDMIAKNTFSLCKKILDISILSLKIRYKNKSQLSRCNLVRLYIYINGMLVAILICALFIYIRDIICLI